MQIIKSLASHLDKKYVGKYVVVTRSSVSYYKVGDIYKVVAPKCNDYDYDLQHMVDGVWVDLGWNGWDAEFALVEFLGEQLELDFS